jgi:tRNA(Glu) U13 pseudouridine synthase TruD
MECVYKDQNCFLGKDNEGKYRFEYEDVLPDNKIFASGTGDCTYMELRAQILDTLDYVDEFSKSVIIDSLLKAALS